MTQLMLPAQEVFVGHDHCTPRAPRTPAGSLYPSAMLYHEFQCDQGLHQRAGPQPLYECGACQYMGHRVTEVADALVIYVYCICGDIGHTGDASLYVRGPT